MKITMIHYKIKKWISNNQYSCRSKNVLDKMDMIDYDSTSEVKFLI